MGWNEIPEINLYSDGGAEPNPGKGGFGVIMSYKGIKREFSQGYMLTTNNRMELMGVIFGLERLVTKSTVNVFTDSRYVIDGIEQGWAKKWKSQNWFRTKNEKAINSDLWERLLNAISIHETVTFNWIKGHAGHRENERCDEIALQALNGNNLFVDEGYNPNEVKVFKVETEGDLCRKCNTKVIKKQTKKKAPKADQTYYFDYYLLCPNCKTMYMVEDAKREVNNQNDSLFN